MLENILISTNKSNCIDNNTLLEIVSGIKMVFILSGKKACLNSFINLSLRFWSLYRYLNPLYSRRYKERIYTKAVFTVYLKLQSKIIKIIYLKRLNNNCFFVE